MDRLLGRLMARLKSQGMYDDTLIVVTADHGFAWQVGVPTRRSVSRSNVNELGPVPLFVKAPGQTHGRVNDALAQTLDVTPTIADVLNVPLGYRTDGSSAFSRAVRARREVSLTTRDFSSIVRMSARRWKAQRRAVVRRRLRQLGSGDWASLYTSLGPHRELIGRDAASARSPTGTRATISLSRSFARVRRSSGVVPCQIAGRIRDSGAAARARPGDRREWPNRGSWAKLPPRGRDCGELRGHGSGDALHEGRNEVEVLEVTDEGRWFYWLAAELAAALLLAGCAGFGDDVPPNSAERHPPVVVVVFDEFPADDLLGPDGQIDAERFPNFAELASMSTWFPNGHTQYDSTFKAVRRSSTAGCRSGGRRPTCAATSRACSI